MYDLIIVGAGASARELRQFLPQCFPAGSVRLKGFLSNNPRDLDPFKIPEPILGDPDTYVPQENDRFLIGIGQIGPRRRIVEALKLRGAVFQSLIHPTAYVDSTAILGEGCIVYPFATIMNNVQFGNFVMLNLYSSAGHDAQIADYCVLSPYATMNGFSILEEEVFLGTHSSVLAYHRVGSRSKVSANSVVSQDAKPRTLVFGVPGRHIPIIAQ